MNDDYPPEGTPLDLRDGAITYLCRVENYEGKLMVVALNAESRNLPPPAAGAEIRAHWTLARGQMNLGVAYSGVFDKGEMVFWRLKPVGEVTIVQRRRFVRTTYQGQIVVTFYGGMKSGAQVKGTVVDISEGGARCTFPLGELQAGDRLEIDLNIDGELWMNGSVLRTKEAAGRVDEVVITFDEMTPAMADKIRKFVFAKELERRRSSNK